MGSGPLNASIYTYSLFSCGISELYEHSFRHGEGTETKLIEFHSRIDTMQMYALPCGESSSLPQKESTTL